MRFAAPAIFCTLDTFIEREVAPVGVLAQPATLRGFSYNPLAFRPASATLTVTSFVGGLKTMSPAAGRRPPISHLRAHPRAPTRCKGASSLFIAPSSSALARDARIAWSSLPCTASLLWRRRARRHPPSSSLATPRSATVSKPRIQLGSSGLRPTSQRRLVHLCCRRTTTTVSDSSSSPPGVEPT